MCGIAGINFPNKLLITKMTKALSHRGPDSSGVFVDKKVSLGHRRLSILDTSDLGQQPMEFDGLYLTFNGEIYNFKQIKKSLQKLGHRFKSNSDSEVILHAYKQWGANCVQKFNGIWAFAIYDSHSQKLFLSRDRFGVKPLFYFEHAGEFLFASEIKSILEHDIYLSTDLNSLNWYFWQKYIPSDSSIYSQINQVPPGNNLIYNLNSKKFSLKPYYNLIQKVLGKLEKNLSDRLESVETLLKNSVKNQMISDVPLGTFLSGGVDSALVSYFSKTNNSDLHTFSMGFSPKSFDESVRALKNAKTIDTNHHQFNFKIDDQILLKIFDHLDQPFADPTLIPMAQLSFETKKHVTVALSGDGADEVFGGYDSYIGGLLADKLPNFLIQILKPMGHLIPDSQKKINWSFLIKRLLLRYDKHPIERHLKNMATQTEFERMELMIQGYIKQFFSKDYDQFDTLQKLQLTDFEYYLPGDILYKTDLASMMSGLEVRVPYLDHELVETGLSLPSKYKNNIWRSKILLRQIAQKYLGNEIAFYKKRGFSVPLFSFINQSKFLKELILDPNYYDHMWLDFEQVKNLWNQQITYKIDNTRILWQVAIFNYWYFKYKKYIYV